MTPGDDEDPSLAHHPPRAVDVGDVIRDRFVLEAELGAGGMGRVFKALDLRRLEAHDRRPHVAVKLLTHAFRQHPASFVALQREARRAQTLAHPNIISVFDFDREGSLVYLIMEYLHGRTLDDTLAQPDFAGMGFEHAMRIIEPIGQALAFAHGHGIVHSDLKPSNIFLTDDGRVKVIDFGIARAFRLPDAADGDATLFDASSLRAFSPPYASPELIDGDEADPRDDIFSLACITYELISGRHPFGRRSAVAARAAKQEPEKLPNLTRGQWAAIRRGLCFARSERTASIDGFMAGLAPHASATARLRPVGAKAAGALRDMTGRLDPRPAAKGLWQLAAELGAALRGFAARLDPRPVAWRWRPRARETAAGIAPVLARLKPNLAGKTLRLPAALAAAVLLIGGLAWLVQSGRWTVPARTDATSTASAPAALAGGDAAPAVPEPKLDEPAAVASVAPVEAAADLSPADGPQVVSPPDQGTPQSPFRDCQQCPEMAVVPAGTFLMGAPPTDADAEREELPQRQVAFERPFAIGLYEVTERQWAACASDGVCRGDRPGVSVTPSDLPKTDVDWQDAQAFIGWLNGKTAGGYRLPTEAEWEYAARAGAATRYPWGEDIGENNANCRDCGAPMGGRQAAPVGSFAANGFGVFDMIGNVWEWTADCTSTSASRRKVEQGVAPSCTRRLLRGGSWANSAKAVRVTQRLSANPTLREDIVGFRVARDAP